MDFDLQSMAYNIVMTIEAFKKYPVICEKLSRCEIYGCCLKIAGIDRYVYFLDFTRDMVMDPEEFYDHAQKLWREYSSIDRWWEA